jgi:hypothetical protein
MHTHIRPMRLSGVSIIIDGGMTLYPGFEKGG